VDREVFLDSAYAIALAVSADQHHNRALALADQLELERTKLITTRAVLLEIGNALSKLRYRSSAVNLLLTIEADPTTEIVDLDLPYYAKSLALFRSRADKEWGLIDCFSFTVMKERGLKQALTSDEHFEQAGFEALLREPVD
jgi:uncharacterized protein